MLALPCLKFPSILHYNDVTKEGDDTKAFGLFAILLPIFQIFKIVFGVITDN